MIDTYTTISSLEEFPELAKAVGNLTIAWSHAERILYLSFWVASETTQQKAFEIYEGLPNFQSRYKMIEKLLSQNDADHPLISGLIQDIRVLVQSFAFRNEVAHRTWAKDTKNNLVILDHRITKTNVKVKPISEHEIREVIVQINGASDRILQTIQRIFPNNFAPF